MMTPEQIDAVCQDMIEQLRARLSQGQVDYGDRSFSADPRDLVDEIDEELVDVVGWAIPLRKRLADLRAEVGRLEVEIEIARAIQRVMGSAVQSVVDAAATDPDMTAEELEPRIFDALVEPVRGFVRSLISRRAS